MRHIQIYLMVIIFIACSSDNTIIVSRNQKYILNEVGDTTSIVTYLEPNTLCDSSTLSFYSNGMLKASNYWRGGKHVFNNLDYYSELKSALYSDDIDTLIFESPIPKHLKYYDSLGNLMFERKYDESGDLLSESGQPFGWKYFQETLDINETLDMRFYVTDIPATIDKFDLYLISSSDDTLSNTTLNNDNKYGAYFFNYNFESTGKYKVLIKWKVLELFSGKDTLYTQTTILNVIKSNMI